MNFELKTYEIKVSQFISQNPRNKLFIISQEINGVNYLNLDQQLSTSLIEIKLHSHFSLKAKELIADYLITKLMHCNQYGHYLAISNIGILLEKELQFDFKAFLDQYSQNQTLFLKWDGEIIDNKLYFLTKQNGIEIDISDLSYIII